MLSKSNAQNTQPETIAKKTVVSGKDNNRDCDDSELREREMSSESAQQLLGFGSVSSGSSEESATTASSRKITPTQSAADTSTSGSGAVSVLRRRGKGSTRKWIRHKRPKKKWGKSDDLSEESMAQMLAKMLCSFVGYVCEWARVWQWLTLNNAKKLTLNIACFNLVFVPCLLFAATTLPLALICSRVILGSFTWTLRRNYQLASAMYRIMGLTGLLLPSPVIYCYQLVTLISLVVDLLFFPEIKHIEIKSPVFVTGCARSGTTYCHRVLTSNGTVAKIDTTKLKLKGDDQFAVFRLWEILFPSVCLRYLIQPFVAVIDSVVALFEGYDLLKGAYDYRLNGEAHEEAILSLHSMAGDFWVECHPVGFFWGTQFDWLAFRKTKDPLKATQPSADFWKVHTSFLKQMLQRQVFFTGKQQVIAKSPSLPWCLPQVVEQFPDCKIVLLARNPCEMLKSNFSLMKTSWTLLYGKQRVEEIWPTAVKNLIWRRHEQWRRTLQFLKTGASKRVLVVRYGDLKQHISAVVAKVFEHCRLPLTDSVRDWAQAEDLRQRSRKRKHSVHDLAYYRIPVRPVREAFRNVVEHFQFVGHWK